MDTLSYKTISANKATVQKEWVVVDATDQVLGRLSAKVAKLLRGKYKPSYTPHVDCGNNATSIDEDRPLEIIQKSSKSYPAKEKLVSSIVEKPICICRIGTSARSTTT